MSFKNYLKNQDLPGIAFTFGRNNPMTQGNQENFNALAEFAKKNKMDAKIYTSYTQNPKKNPLNLDDKIHFLEMIAPENTTVLSDPELKNAFQILEDLIKNQGYRRIAFMVGADREGDFQSMKKYTKEWSLGEAYLDIIVTGNRKPGCSGTDMRTSAKENDFVSFNENLPNDINGSDAQELFEKVKEGLEK